MPAVLARLAARNDNLARETTVGELLIDWARRTPCLVAVADDASDGAPPRTWTYENLRDDAATLAVALLSRYAPGERIAIWAHACPEGVLLQFATAFAGLVLVTIDPAWPAANLAEILDGSGCVGLFVMSHGDGRRLNPDARAPLYLREIVDLANRRALFAKHGCIDGLPEVRPADPAQIHYPIGRAGSPRGETVLHRDVAETLRAAHDRVVREAMRRRWDAPSPVRIDPRPSDHHPRIADRVSLPLA